jgi:DNA-binding NarL/FixJ family response regulator
MQNRVPAADRVTVVVIDDNAIFRRAVQAILNRYARVELVGMASDSETGVYLVGKTMPDVALVDVRMPEVDGTQCTRLLKERYPGVQTIALTVSDDQEDLLEMLRAGARGYVLKTSSPEELVAAILAASRGESWLSPRMASQLIAEFTRLPPAQIRGGLSKDEMRLTPREQAVLRHLALGKTNREISQSLQIAETTVKTHLKNILEKLHVRNRLEAALLALRGDFDEPSGAGSVDQ